MRRSKKCGICNYQFTFDDKFYINPFVAPFDEGAKYYFNLWHYFIEKCPECKYASIDISSTSNRNIIKDKKYLAVRDIQQLKMLNKARPNRIADYLYASVYYESIGDELNMAKCLFQASDLVYNEIMYWDEYIVDNASSLSAIQNKAQNNEFQRFADSLFAKAIETLENYHEKKPEDIDATILLAGTLASGDKIQAVKGATILSKLHEYNLSSGQAKAVEYLLSNLK